MPEKSWEINVFLAETGELASTHTHTHIYVYSELPGDFAALIEWE